MFAGFRRKKKVRRAAERLYAEIVRQARTPGFYTNYGVPDTVDGRFELICLHVFLLMERFFREGAEGKAFSQALFDIMFRDMDRSLREMGVGDLSLPKHIRRMMKGFNGRATQYHKAMQSGDQPELQAVLLKNLYATSGVPRDREAVLMARYAYENALFLGGQAWDALMEGTVAFRMINNIQDQSDDQRDYAGMAA